MANAKTVVKKASRKRGSVSLAKVRQAIAAISARNGAGRSIRPAVKRRPTRKASRPAHTSS